MMSHKSHSHKKRLTLTACVTLVAFSLVVMYCVSFLKPAASNRSDLDHVHVEEIELTNLKRTVVQDDATPDVEPESVDREGDVKVRGHISKISKVIEDSDSDAFSNDIPLCDLRFSELIPCLDRNLHNELKLKLNHSLMEHYERHCPPPDLKLNCRIPAPPNYKLPIQWPASRDQVWRSNVPHTFLALEKSDQHWMTINGDKINFPGGGTHFHDGADKYIASLAQMLGYDENLSNHGNIRTVLDVGCGVASFGAYLLPLDILAMSLAPNDVHENQIQFALERGIPAALGVLGTKRLPFPSKSFDLAHCSRCRIDWLQRDGMLLLEVDRLLRPGGLFAWSSPPAYRDDEEDVKIWEAMSDLVERMCWEIAAKEKQTVIWMKTKTIDCYDRRPEGIAPPLCDEDDDPDEAWGVPMKACISRFLQGQYQAGEKGLAAWPNRLTSPPLRLTDLGINSQEFLKDNIIWRSRVDFYWEQLDAEIEEHTFRNIMDMKAHFGGFAAALVEKPVWVMNIIPTFGSNTLKIIYDRGLIGALHDWCESYSTYPRTYDLIHAWNVFSDLANQGCSSMEDLLLEMDRILRPKGFVIIRDKETVINQIQTRLQALHWNAWSRIVDAVFDELSNADEKILFARKQLMTLDDESS
ncbi:hypothetical protein KP509_30G017700 [Ceratopteris richardii]|nr:hypothetical protein KP509_30G017700 [Ceratopteris richardii]KAH7289759.1 hypothetical protein KP509_30G017700 [Ceratopteris richardii]